MPQETIEAASTAASIAEKIALSAFVEFVSSAVYRHVLDSDELQSSCVCFVGEEHPETLRLLRLATSAQKSYHNALLHLSSLIEVPDDDDDELLLATEGTVER